jgi:diacylglycerol kinase (ATP)
MDVVLFYSEGAGDGIGLPDIRRVVTSAGHRLVHVVERQADPASLAAVRGDLVVAAGGDGTVGAAARALAGSGVPLAVMPIGTANNIARSLGIAGDMDEIAASWHTALRRPLDLGRVRLPDGDELFLEAVGGGLIPAGISAHEAQPGADAASVDQKLPDAVRAYRDALERLRPRHCTVSVDGETMSASLLLVEVLNIRSVGPHVELAPNVDSSDGQFSVVTATGEDRDSLRDYLRALDDDDEAPAAFVAAHAREVTIRGWDTLHVDDRLVRVEPSDEIALSIEPAALEVLIPA